MAANNNTSNYLPQVDPYVPAAAYDASMAPQTESTPAVAPAAAPAGPAEAPGKSEVGWMFVEQYYTTLNKSPEKLHLFYNKKSVLTWGNEGEVVPCVSGRSEIAERIKREGFNDCKVRVTNVDSQGSLNNSIIIQVIGEMSNDGNLNRKFSQSFFLAEQPHGYYVHNDIFRFLNDEDEELLEEGEELAEETVEEQPAAAETEPVQELAQEPEAAAEEPKVEETPAEEPKAEEPEVPTNGLTNGTPAEEETKAEAEPEAAPVEEETKVEETPAAEEPKAEEPVEEKKEEEPKAEEKKEEETPAPPPAPVQEKKAAPPAPALPAAPPKPKTWANLVAGGASKVAAAVVNTAAAVAPAVVAPAKAETPAAEKQDAAAQAATSPAPATPGTPASSGGWQSVGETRRHQSKASTAGGDVTLAFIRNVHEKVDTEVLRKKLATFGPLKQFEVSKQRNCAFVEFETAAAFKAAQAANPHTINGETINIEERRPRQGQPGYAGRGGYEGGRGGYTPRGGRGEGRGGFQPRGDGGKFYDGNRPPRGGAPSGRGGFAPRGRGGQTQA
ncbi:NTF2-domain-containing protein [Ascobolus immersus RN42]|uniref:NTF2-domain-containing protein n=1 Tax=Ascobolus immersus RN42 TaxID=1160509 RepID=A0A3N4HN57_ASCIM|nr:NTF2-domain-containing protein [Ascobolus immersus RN42]